jgi:hypothetical protein
MSQGKSYPEAYTIVTNNRSDYLLELSDNDSPKVNIDNFNNEKNDSSMPEDNPLLGKWIIEPSECHPEAYLGLSIATDGLITLMEVEYTDIEYIVFSSGNVAPRSYPVYCKYNNNKWNICYKQSNKWKAGILDLEGNKYL